MQELYYKKNIKRFNVDLTYVGDFNQYSNILDSDNDSYPDKIDPKNNKKNFPDEMIIVDDDTTYTNDLISLDNIDQSQFHAFGIGLKYQIANICGSDVFITGDIGGYEHPVLVFHFQVYT